MLWKNRGPLDASLWASLENNPLPWAGLATSLPGDHEYRPSVEGNLPPELRGTLYRNGPGLFDRAGGRKRMILDGDGLVQAFHFRDHGVDYIARYARTPKYEEEERAGRFVHATWSTLAPGGPWRNLGGRIAGQAGITVGAFQGRLYAFDESQPAFELDPVTLRSIGTSALDPEFADRQYLAHFKWDRAGKGWAPLSVRFGKELEVTATFLDDAGRVTGRAAARLPRSVYMHDWFLTENYLVILMHPAFLPLGNYLRVLLGVGTFAEAIDWRPREGNLVAVIPRAGGAPRYFEGDAAWMWHSVNAYERGDEIVADFVGDPTGGGLGTDDTSFFDLMAGKAPVRAPEPTGVVLRYVLSLKTGALRRELLDGSFNFEMPYVDPRRRCLPHRYAYLARADRGELFWSAVARLDTHTGRREEYHCGAGAFCAEPVFVPRRDAAEGAGWLLTQVYDSRTRRSRLDVLDAERLPDGPLATVHLEHHVPISFHGCFQPA